jgi:Domain of unknown function (DUF4397)
VTAGAVRSESTVTEGDTLRGPWRGRRRAHLLAGTSVVVLGVGSTLVAAGGTAAAAATGQVYVVQGIVGTSVSVLLDGRELVASAQPKSVVGPLQVPAGQHVLVLRAGSRTVTGARFTVAAGQSIDLVAHRAADAGQEARIVVFRNDVSPVGPGKARLVVGHAAVAPPADVRVGGRVLFHDVASGEALSLLVPARTYSVDVVASDGSTTILAPVRLTVRPGTLTRVFAVGDPTDQTADAVVQVLAVSVVGAGRPSSVPTGNGGQAADSLVGDGLDPAPVGIVGAGLALLMAARGRRSARAARLARLPRRRRSM